MILFMQSSVDLSEAELEIALNFLLTFGADWVERNKVRQFICESQNDGRWLHDLLVNKVDHLKPFNGITHRKLKPEVLDRIRVPWGP